MLPETVQLSETVSLLHEVLSHVEMASCPASVHDMLLWVLFFAGFLAHGEQRQFFVGKIKEIVMSLELRSFAQVQRTLSLFLYRESVFSPVFLDLWEEVVV